MTISYHHVPMAHPARFDAAFQPSTTVNDIAFEDSSSLGTTAEWQAVRPLSGTIVAVYVVSKGQGHSMLPTYRPRVALWRHASRTGPPTEVGFEFDNSTTLAEFDSRHVWFLDGLTEKIEFDRFYSVHLTGEFGPNSKIGHQYFDIYLAVESDSTTTPTATSTTIPE